MLALLLVYLGWFAIFIALGYYLDRMEELRAETKNKYAVNEEK